MIADTTAAAELESILAALQRLGQGPAEERVRLGELVGRLDARGPALVLFLLAAQNLTPGPSMPGFSTIFGVPLCIVAFEMMLGRQALRLPKFLARIEIPRGRVARIVARLEPLLRRVERILRPRWPSLAGPAATRGLGAACLALGILLALPIPVFSLLPAAAIVATALGILTRDGVAVAVGLAAGVAAVVVFVGLVVAAVAAFAPS